jgi:hypothetical protein
MSPEVNLMFHERSDEGPICCAKDISLIIEPDRGLQIRPIKRKDHRDEESISLLSGDMAEEKIDLEYVLADAKALEREFDWLHAAALYRDASSSLSETDSKRKAEIGESIAHALSKAAFQADSLEEFRKRVESALDAYGRAQEALQKHSDPTALARAIRCQAMSDYLRFWLEPDTATRRKHVDNAWNHARRALESFLAMRDFPELGKTCSDIFVAAALSYDFEPGVAERTAILTELTRYVGEAAEHVTEPRQLAENLVQLAGCLEISMVFLPCTTVQMTDIRERSHNVWNKALEADQEAAILEKTKMTLLYAMDWTIGKETCPAILDRQLMLAEKADDRLAVGSSKSEKAMMLIWDTGPIEDPDELNKASDEIKKVSEEARREFGTISFVSPDFLSGHWASAPSSPWTSAILSWREIDPAKKRVHALDGLVRAREQLTFAEESRYPYAVVGAHFGLGFLLLEAAKCDGNKKTKQALLLESVEHKKKGMEGEDTYCQSHFWNRGIIRCQLAQTEVELGKTEDDGDKRSVLLRSSASHMKDGLGLCMAYFSEPELYDETARTMLGLFWRDYGIILRLCWEHSQDKKDLESACAAFEKSAELQTKAGVLSRAAECYWEAARTYDLVGEHSKASNRFDHAAECYREASGKIGPLKGYYEDFSQYMRGWSEIEKAKHHHSRQEPSSSREHFQKASELHASTNKWSFLALNYSAWAQVENGEDLSQKEDSRGSVDAFKGAARLFQESKKNLQAQLGKIESTDEKQMVTKLIDATDTRRDLCLAQVVLEEARLLDRQGRMADASEKYGQGAEMLQRIRQRVTSEQDRKEIDLSLTLANAWRAMAKAEAETSPELYQEAARLFEEAKSLSSGEKTRNLAMGHSRFCKALEAGAKFEDTGDQALHSISTDHLESAAKHYMKAGQEKASEYSRASRLLFDAYVQMGNASKESDHDKKAVLYAIAEKILEASAASFDKAEQPGRKAQVHKLLERVRQDRQLAVSLTQVLRAPDIASTAMAFSSPTYETAVGLDRFEHADIQATMIVKPKDMHVGEDLRLDIELVNAGKGPAQLTKVDELVPPGFDVQNVPDRYRIEDSYLNMRGRRLSAMRTEDIKVVLRPTAHGRYILKPRVLYLDESGKYKSYEPEPVEVTVKELGISGWLKGPEKR